MRRLEIEPPNVSAVYEGSGGRIRAAERLLTQAGSVVPGEVRLVLSAESEGCSASPLRREGRSKTTNKDAERLYRDGIEREHSEASQLENDRLAESIQARFACYRVAQKSRIADQNVLEALSQDPATSRRLLATFRKHVEANQCRSSPSLASI